MKPLKVVQYNVLSSALSCRETYPRNYPLNTEDEVNPEKRLERVIKKLQAAMDSQATTLFTLQEVSAAWCDPLGAMFYERNYQFIFSAYGKEKNGFMGVAIAFPCSITDAAPQISSIQLTDTRQWYNCSPTPTSAGATTIYDHNNLAASSSSWFHASRKENILLTAVFTLRGGKKFTLATYHMPCAFKNRDVMVIHSAMAFQYLQWMGYPFIFAGDFNFCPGDECYRMLTSDTGAPPELIRRMHGQPTEDWWRPKFSRCPVAESAQKLYRGSEPAFTCAGVVREGYDHFAGTLDYIWLSAGDWAVDATSKPAEGDGSDCNLPTVNEPSDHLMITATVRIAAFQSKYAPRSLRG